jgi:hypothetical protein
VTFSLPGFGTVRREGLELTPNSTATVNAELKIGALEESVTVSGGAPLVDVQNVTQQNVLSRALLDTVPTNKGMLSFAALTPAVVSPTNAQDVGGSKGELSVRMVIHGGKTGDQKLLQDGMRYNSLEGGGTGRGFFFNPASSQEVLVELGSGGSAEYDVGGVHVNIVPKDGGNTFTGYLFTNYTNDALQGDNLSAELKDRGLQAVNGVENIYDINGALGGPILKDKIWFFTAHRHWGQSARVANRYHNATQGTFAYTPDLSRPAKTVEWNQSDNIRFTWQATQKDKVTLSWDVQNNCSCQVNLGVGNIAWEAVPEYRYSPNYLLQATWTRPITNRLLFQAGSTMLYFDYPNNRQRGVSENDISILELSSNFRYNAAASNYGHKFSSQNNHRVAVSYVTGAHNFKVGGFFQQGVRRPENFVNQDINYTFLNGSPQSLTQWATPIILEENLNADVGLYAQDQWTIRRLTLNLGIRFDYLNASDSPTTQPGGRFVGPRSFDGIECIPCWKDINPRTAASYDLFGNGRTAVKGSFGRYVQAETVSLADQFNPANTAVNSVSRTWGDGNGNFVPDCDLGSAAANGECGAMSNAAFGQSRITTRLDPEVITGWQHRPYNWQASASIQHQLTDSVALSGGYYRTWFGNFRVTDNLAVTPDDYSPYCITAPSTPGLPGGGTSMCGFYDLNPNKFGQVDNLVRFSGHYGDQREVYNGVDVNFNVRMFEGARLSGGVNIGNGMVTNESSTSSCFVVDSPQQLRFCELNTPYQARFKMLGSYPLPGDFQVSGTFQTLPGPPLLATYSATNAEIVPSLGRNLSAGARGTATLELLEPYTQFEGRINQLDLRLAKVLKTRIGRFQAMFDVYNVLNANPVTALITTLGPAWQRPTQILDARLFKFGMQYEF